MLVRKIRICLLYRLSKAALCLALGTRTANVLIMYLEPLSSGFQPLNNVSLTYLAVSYSLRAEYKPGPADDSACDKGPSPGTFCLSREVL